MAQDPKITPKAVRAPHGATVLELTWADGHKSAYPHRILRGYCPCAGCQGHSGTIQFREGGNLEIRKIQPVGNYALGIEWGDAHDSGIYSFTFLRRLGDLIEAHGAAGLEQLGELPKG